MKSEDKEPLSTMRHALISSLAVAITTLVCSGCTMMRPADSKPLEDHTVALVSAKPETIYNDLFAAQQVGWLGSDGICSVRLSREKTVWLFGDTLIGRIEEGRRTNEYFINNSIAIETRSDLGPKEVNFHWAVDDGKPGSFFVHQQGTAGSFYWPSSGVLVDGELFVFCYPVSTDSKTGLIVSDTTLIRISNPLDPPASWKQEAYDLGLGNGRQGFLSACVLHGPYIYFLGYDDSDENGGTRQMVLARAMPSDIKAGGKREVFQFWVKGEDGPTWGPDPQNLVPLFEPGLTETMPQYDSALGLFILPCKSDGGPTIFVRTARDLTGPWSQPLRVFEAPEHRVSFPIMTYAVKAHPELATRPGEVVLSYATNMATDSLDPLFTPEGLGIYVPRFVRVRLKEEGLSSATPE